MMSRIFFLNFAIVAIAFTLISCSEKDVNAGFHNGHEYIDLGLPSGLLWATCNLGTGSPSGYGDFFAWGDTESKDDFDYNNVSYYEDGEYPINGSHDKYSKYVRSKKHGIVDGKTCLDLSDDAARANWKGNWRIPTKDEWRELIDNCTWTWTKKGFHEGYEVRGNSGLCIFLPSAGWNVSEEKYQGSRGCYWSSSLGKDSDKGYCCDFFNNTYYCTTMLRYYGLSIRPVVFLSQKSSSDDNELCDEDESDLRDSREESEFISCPLCNGSKQVNAGGKILDCPACHGNGNVSELEYNELTEVKECPTCAGTGMVSGITCTICRGTKKISTLLLHRWLCSPVQSENTRNDGNNENGIDNPGKTCVACRGLGRCPVCRGMGYTEGYGLTRNPCSGCWHPGSGTHDGDGKCGKCQGTGRID